MLRRLSLVGSTLVLAILLLSTQLASASNIQVSASIPYEVPSEQSVIASPGNGTTLDTSSIVLSGTCGELAPIAVVSIWRSDQLLGSTTCKSGGIFNITVSLINGANTLRARTSNASGIYGPDGPAVTFFYQPRVDNSVNQPAPENTPSPSTLEVFTEQVFDNINPLDKDVVLRVVVRGGETPYTISIDWGNGSSESRVVNEAGIYEFRYTYDEVSTYQVTISLIDIRGRQVSYTLAIVGLATEPPPALVDQQTDSVRSSFIIRWLWGLLLIAGLVIGYFFGRWSIVHARDTKSNTSKNSARTKSKRTLLLFLWVVLFFGISFAAYSYAMQPVVSTPAATEGVINVQGATSQLKIYSTKYASFRAPDYLKLNSQTDTPNNPVYEQVLFVHSDSIRSDQLGITIGRAESGDVNNISFVKARLTEGSSYEEVELSSAPPGAISFRKTDSQELSTFFINESKYAAVVTSGAIDRQNSLENFHDLVLSSWSWR